MEERKTYEIAKPINFLVSIDTKWDKEKHVAVYNKLCRHVYNVSSPDCPKYVDLASVMTSVRDWAKEIILKEYPTPKNLEFDWNDWYENSILDWQMTCNIAITSYEREIPHTLTSYEIRFRQVESL